MFVRHRTTRYAQRRAFATIEQLARATSPHREASKLDRWECGFVLLLYVCAPYGGTCAPRAQFGAHPPAEYRPAGPFMRADLRAMGG